MKTPSTLATVLASLVFFSTPPDASTQALPEEEQSQLEKMIKDIDLQLHGGTKKKQRSGEEHPALRTLQFESDLRVFHDGDEGRGFR
ncbi:MAG: hypothetical protein AAGA58_09210 [Verrucomicrobiota bacterium]